MVKGSRRETVLAVLVFGLVAALFLWRPILAGTRGVFLPNDLVYGLDLAYPHKPPLPPPQNNLLSDVTLYYYPYVHYATAQLAHGRFPLWNPLIAGGTPFYATAQAALFDPVNLLTRPFAGGEAVWLLGAWLRLLLAGLGTYGLLRALGRRPVAALASGIIFAYCGFLTVWLNYSVTTTAIWLPAALWATLRLVQSGRGGWMALVALILGAQFYGGHPETSFVIGLTWGLFALTQVIALRRVQRRTAWRRSGQLAGAALLGIGLGFAQLAPLLALISHSELLRSREAAMTPATLTLLHTWRVSLQLLLTTGLPNISGTPTEGNYWYPLSVTNFNEQISYCGLAALGLAGVGLRCRVAGRGFFAGASITALLLMLHLPILDLLYVVPGFRQGYGARWALLFSLAVAVLAGLGLEDLLTRTTGYKRAILGGTLGLSLLLGGVLALLARLRREPPPTWLARRAVRVLTQLLDPAHATVYWPFLFAVGGLGVVIALSLAAPNRRPVRQIAALVWVILLLADGLTFGSAYNPVIPGARNLPLPPLAAWLQPRLGHARFVAAGNILIPNLGMLYGLRDLRGYEDLAPQEYVRVFDPLWHTAALSSPTNAPLTVGDLHRFDIGAVRYVVTGRRLLRATERGLIWRAAFGGATVYENTHVLPRAYGVYTARFYKGAGAVGPALDDPAFDPQQTVLLEGSRTPDAPVMAPPPAVRFVADGAEEVILEADFAQRGYMVLADTWTPDWQAEVDGQPAAVLQANGVFRAVPLARGRHRVRFAYHPLLVYGGAAVSGVALAAICVLALGAGLRRRSPVPPVGAAPP